MHFSLCPHTNVVDARGMVWDQVDAVKPSAFVMKLADGTLHGLIQALR